jgi:predicted nucleic acid-binding protein
MYLIDTVVLSELRKLKRDPGVVAWFEQQRTTDLFVISIGEIERGITRQHTRDPGFAAALAASLDRVLVLYGEQILPFDLKTARRWDHLSAAIGNDRTDLMIAGTALEHARANDIVLGRRAITIDTAIRLGRYFGISSEFWTNLQTRYDLDVADRTVRRRIEQEISPRAA